MTRRPDPRIAEDDPTGAPRKNGELVFAAPWEGRIFGMAVALSDQNAYAWEEFRDQLKSEIAAATARGDTSGYYERWLRSFEVLLVAKGLIAPAELAER